MRSSSGSSCTVTWIRVSGYEDMAQVGLTYTAAIKGIHEAAQVVGPVLVYGSASSLAVGLAERVEHGARLQNPFSNPVDRIAHGTCRSSNGTAVRPGRAAAGPGALDYVDVDGYPAPDTIQFKPVKTARCSSSAGVGARFLGSMYQVGGDVNDAPMLCDANVTGGQKYPHEDGDHGIQPRGLEHINGALAQADVLGVFGREGLDLATIRGPPDAGTPGMSRSRSSATTTTGPAASRHERDCFERRSVQLSVLCRGIK